jgi:hypothetical protein
VALVRTDISEECIAFIIRVRRIGEVGATLAVINNRKMLRRNIMRGEISFLCSVRQLLVTANVVLNLPILVALTMEAIRSSETSVLTRATWPKIAEHGILQPFHR